jgi:hypothetical protein
MTGGISVTVTEVKHELALPELSVAVQRTGVAPNPNVDPDAGAQLAVTPGQLSEKGAKNLAVAPLELVHWIVFAAGQVMVGG